MRAHLRTPARDGTVEGTEGGTNVDRRRGDEEGGHGGLKGLCVGGVDVTRTRCYVTVCLGV